MISKNRIKQIKSLELKKFRKREGLFVAEGHKLVGELLSAFELCYVAATEEWFANWGKLIKDNVDCDIVSIEELKRASLQQHPQDVLALFRIPSSSGSLATYAEDNIVLVLDGVQDPGNLGTIVRLADWFGIEHIFCSEEAADIYNPKSVQATMGAISRVSVHYVNLINELSTYKGAVYGTFLDGANIYESKLSTKGVIVMGNEGNGISAGVSRLVNSRLYIPPFPIGSPTVESLNVAMATAVVCAEFRRRSYSAD